MTVLQRGLPLGGVALLLSTTGALADVTAQQVWDDWRSGAETFEDVKVTVGSEDYANGVLTVTDLNVDMVDFDGTMRSNLPELVFTEQSDGSVQITMSPEQTVSFSNVADWGSATYLLELIVSQTDAVGTATGAPGAMNYEMSIPTLSVRLGQLELSDEVTPADAAFVMSNVVGNMSWGPNGDLLDIDYTVAADRADLKFSMDEPDGTGSVNMSGSYEGLQTNTSMAYPTGVDLDDADEAFEAGLTVEWALQLGQSNMSFDFSDSGDNVQWAMQLGGASNLAAVSRDAFSYDTKLTEFAFDMATPDLPFPVAMSAGELGLGIAMPMSASPTPAPFAGQVTLADVSVDDGLWDMVDAGRVIPRDPATVVADLSGTVTLTRDLYDDPDDVFGGMEPPGMLNSLEINTVDLAFGGATAHADGAFTFDNSDLETFDGMPRPEGQASAVISGVNSLMEKLGQIGLLPPEQAMGVTMMMGMFAVPDGDDQMTSSVEFTADGKVLVNGMPLPF